MSDSSLYFAGATLLAAAVIGYYFINSNSERKVLKKDNYQEFPLIQKVVLSPNSAIFRFGLPKPTDVLGLPIGQHIQISAEINDKEIVRSYTPTSLDLDSKGYFDLLIKVYEKGNISKYIDNLKLGESIKVRGPKGFFIYEPNMVSEFCMVAGGTGITPMYQIIKAICSNPDDKTKVNLLYGSVTENDILLKAELDQLCEENPNINVIHYLNSPPEDWNQGVGFINKDVIAEKFPAPKADIQLLLCGPPAMVSSLKKAANELGFQKARPVSKAGDQIFVF